MEKKKNLKPKRTESLHVFRTQVQIRVETGQTLQANSSRPSNISANVLFNEVKREGLRLFSSTQVSQGKTVSLSFDSPRKLFVKARVVRCWELIQDTKILQNPNHKYRWEVEFIFESDEQRQEVDAFIQELEKQVLTGRTAAA